jgi:DNA-binding transcriptional LysR family regulator
MVRYTLRQCAYFRAVAEHGGIAQASRKLNISQPSVAEALDKLEELIGFRLFERRHARGLTLTPQGRSFLVHVVALEKQAEQVAREAEALAAQVSGEIRLGCFFTLAPFYLAGLIRAHLRASPGVRVSAYEMDLPKLAAGVRDGSLDFALTYELGPYLKDLALTRLTSVTPTVLLSADHPRASQRAIWLRDLAAEPYVMFDLPGSRSYYEDLLRRHKLAPDVVYASASLEAVRSAVGNGFGYTLAAMRPNSARSYDGKRLKALAIEDEIEPLNVVLAERETQRDNPLAARFVDHAKRYFAAR